MKSSYDLIIIGGGPAGMSAGIYACRYGLKTLIIESYYFGGQMNLTTEIKNYPGFEHIGGLELTNNMKEQYISNGGELEIATISKIDFEKNSVKIKNRIIKYKALIIATGVVARKLELKNEEELRGKGISYCAICDGYFFKGKDVAVVGSGNSALEDAIYLSGIANKVYIVSKHKKFIAQEVFIKEIIKKKNVEIFYDYMPSKIMGKDFLEGIEIKSNETEDLKEIKVDGMFIQIGRKADNSLFKEYIDCSVAGFIKADKDMRTNLPNVFVAGDIRDKDLRQIVTACADGAIAANSAFKYVSSL